MSKHRPTEEAATIHQAMQRDDIVLIDVREAGEHAAERIPGALLFPLSHFDPAGLPQHRQLVLHCGSGTRSAAAYDQCAKAGVAVRSHMSGGIGAWKRAGLPTVR
jgi:rhodanese-related sulfurtransferase